MEILVVMLPVFLYLKYENIEIMNLSKNIAGTVKVFTVNKDDFTDGWPTGGKLVAEVPADDVQIVSEYTSFRIYYRRGDAVYLRDNAGYKIKITREGLSKILKPGAEFVALAETYKRQMVDVRKAMFL
jgi:hypothetical protein